MVVRSPQRSSHAFKTDWRSVFLVTALVCSTAAHAQVVLDRQQVVSLARRNAPQVRVAGAKVEEARAGRVGAGALSQSNPDLAASIGPRFLSTGTPTVDVALSLAWPIDFYGAPRAKVAVSDARVSAAEAERNEVERLAAREALALWASARVSEDRVTLETRRAALDAEILRIARLRRDAGAVGDGDIALATLIDAEARSRLISARAEHEASLVLLRHRLGLAADEAVQLPTLSPSEGDVTSLDSVLAALDEHPALLRAKAVAKAESSNADLQRRLGLPVPRLLVMGERSPEYTARFGFDLPLPVYQRNQTEVATAEARSQTALVEETTTRETLAADIRAVYARFEGARGALEVLEKATPAIDDTERLAARAYEVGQGSLSQLVSARREATIARTALLDARAALAQSRIFVDLATGAVQ